MPKLAVAIVGAGLMGRWHAACAARAGSDVAAIVDIRTEAARRLARAHPGASCFARLDECLAQCSVDVVHICTPADSHVPLAEIALHAGKPVLVEKPLAPTATQTEFLLTSAAQADVPLGCVLQFPFQRGFQALRQQADRLGEPVEIGYRLCTAGADGRQGEARRNVMYEALPHPFSLFQSLTGGPLDVDAWNVLASSDDDLSARAQHGDLLLDIRLSLRGRPTCNELHVIGTRGTAFVDLYHGYCLWQGGRTSRRTKIMRPFAVGSKRLVSAGLNMGRRIAAREPAYPGLRALIAGFHASIRRGESHPSQADLLLQSARFVDQIRRGGEGNDE